MPWEPFGPQLPPTQQPPPSPPRRTGTPNFWTLKDPVSGKKYEWWSATPPTQEQAEQYIHDQEHMSTWGKLNEGLTRAPSRLARRITGGTGSVPGFPDVIADAVRIHDDDTPGVASMRGFGRGAIEATGDIASEMTSPFNIASTAASLGTYGAARTGLMGAARGFNMAEKGLGAVQAGHGAIRAGQGLYEGEAGDVGAGALEMAFGGLGMGSRIPTRPTPDISGLPARIPPTPPGRPRYGQWMDALPEKPNWVEGEILDDISGPPPGPPGLPPYGGQRVEPSSGNTFFGGRRGVSTDPNLAAEPYVNPPTPEARAFNAMIPQRYKPFPVENASPPYQYAPPLDTSPALGGITEPPSTGIPRGFPKNPTTGLSQMSDADLAFAAKTGDKAAALEIRNRAKAARPAPVEPPPQVSEAGLAPEQTLDDVELSPTVSKLREKLRKSLETPEGSTGLEKVSDDDVAWMAESGDAVARTEAAKRPSMFERLKQWNKEKGETGAVGPGTGKLRAKQTQDRLKRELEEALDMGEHQRAKAIREKLNEVTKPVKAHPDDTALVALFRKGLNPVDNFAETHFILHDGARLTHNAGTHGEAARNLGTDLDTALKNGVIRWSGYGAEIGSPITHAQAEMLADATHYVRGGSYLDVAAGTRRATKELHPGSPSATPEAIRRWVNSHFEADAVAEPAITSPQKALMELGIPEHIANGYSDEVAMNTLRDGSPTSRNLWQQIVDWNKKKGEGGFFKIGRKGGEGETPRPANNKKRQGFINPAKGTPYEETFAKWVNTKRRADVEGVLKAEEFESLKDLGKDGINAFVSGSRTGKLKDVADYFVTKVGQLDEAGVSTKGARHLTDIFENSPAEIDAAYTKMDRKTSYTLETLFRELKRGTDAGLTPKFESVPHMIQWYESMTNRMVANKQFRDVFKQKGWVKLKGEGNTDWVDIPNTLFPQETTKSGGKVGWVASPEFATLLENQLGQGSKVAKWAGDLASTSKNFALSAGIPYTGINAHGANIMARSLMANLKSNPKAIFKHAGYILNPKTALQDLNKIKGRMAEAVQDGMTLTTEGYSYGKKGGSAELVHDLIGTKEGGMLDKAVSKTGEMFEDPLFQKVIPSMKLQHYISMKDGLIKQGMGRANAGKQAADFTNELYGGINWQAMGRSKDLQNLGRATILAPDWLETNMRLGKHSVDALKNPTSQEGKKYREMLMSMGIAYGMANVVNYATSGHLMYQNEPGHTLDVYIGPAFGGDREKKRWLRPFGTAADFVRLPIDMALAATGISAGEKGGYDLGQASEIVGNRLSIPGAAAMHAVTKRDRYGRPILGQDDYGRPIPLTDQGLSLGLEAVGMVTPPYVKGLTDFGLGKIGWEEALVGGTETFPFRYSSTPKPASGGRSRQSRPSRER